MNSRYHRLFKACGVGVRIDSDVHIEHPECFELGDNVVIDSGTRILGAPKDARIGSSVSFNSRCHVVADSPRFIIGDHVTFHVGTYIEACAAEDSSVIIGHHTHFAPYGVLYGHGGLTVGACCNFSAHVVLATVGHDHRNLTGPMALTPSVKGRITVEEDVWVAANSTICAGVTIAQGCVIAANSVLTKDTEPFGFYAGVPACLLRHRDQ